MLFRLIFYLIIIYLVIRLFRNLSISFEEKRKEKTSEGEEMVLDPNCRTYIPKRDAISRRAGGEKFYFCSKKCFREYRAKNG